MTKFSDIIKGQFLTEFSAISVQDMAVAIGLAFLLGLYIVFIYRVTYGGISFSANFAGCLILLSMVTTIVLLVITSNVVLSLGMVGALSIVRFRTAVKEPTDTAFLFWSIATGIICGAGYTTVAVLSALMIGLLFVLVHALSCRRNAKEYLVIACYATAQDIQTSLTKLPGYKLKNLTFRGDTTELVAQVRLNPKDIRKVQSLTELPGVSQVSIMDHTVSAL